VRYIGNRSSGKMGLAVAEEAARRGAMVTLLYGAISVPLPEGVHAIHAPTAEDMAVGVKSLAGIADALIMAAAVADFRVNGVATAKIKKEHFEHEQSMRIQLRPTSDILSSVADLPLVKVGFAAETENLLTNAQDKLRRKGLDMIVGNDVTAEGSGFGADTNQVVLVAHDGSAEELPLLSKREVAARILDRVQALLAERDDGHGRD
jgi:phosphopantothenoylcysteine decarboxylase / phosphopantothenate---cysteine ligase